MIRHLIIWCIVFHILCLVSLLLLFIPHVVNYRRRLTYISANCVSPKTVFPVLNFKQFYFDSSCMKNIWIWTSCILFFTDSFGENNIISHLSYKLVTRESLFVSVTEVPSWCCRQSAWSSGSCQAMTAHARCTWPWRGRWPVNGQVIEINIVFCYTTSKNKFYS